MSISQEDSYIVDVLNQLRIDAYQKYLREHIHYCRSCAKCRKEEKVQTLDELGCKCKDITKLVTYRFICNHPTEGSNMNPDSENNFCRSGTKLKNYNSEVRCSNCYYAQVRILDFGKDKKGCHRYRLVYLCSNGKRMEHYEKGTAMSSYISCKFYERCSDVN